MSKQLDEIAAATHRTETVIDSAIVLIQGFAAQIAALKDDPVALEALANEMNAKSDTLAAAVAANTPAAPEQPSNEPTT